MEQVLVHHGLLCDKATCCCSLPQPQPHMLPQHHRLNIFLHSAVTELREERQNWGRELKSSNLSRNSVSYKSC